MQLFIKQIYWISVFLCTTLLIPDVCSAGVNKRIQFEKGKNSATIKEAVVLGDQDRYTIGASAQQEMKVTISSLENNAVFVIYLPNKQKSPKGAGARDEAMNWQGILPETGDYIVEVGGTRGNASYTLTVAIFNPTDDQAHPPVSEKKSSSNAKTTSVTSQIKKLWKSLNKTKNQCPEVYDYFPKGGIRIFGCHIATFLTYADLQKLANINIFVTGPHTKTELKLSEKYDFGRYNIKFVEWLNNNLIPASQDPAFKESTQVLYDKYVKKTARIYYLVRHLLLSDSADLENKKTTYSQQLKAKTLPTNYHYDFFYFQDLYQDPDYNGNVASSSVAFWIRREVDGTAGAFFRGLSTLIETYDFEFMRTAIDMRCQKAMSTLDQKQCAGSAYELADKRLNAVYKKLVGDLDTERQAKLKTAQQAWITFRDKEAEFTADQFRGGTLAGVILINTLADLTWERVKALEEAGSEGH